MPRSFTIKPLGPVYALLVMARAVGLADVRPEGEPKALAIARDRYGKGRPMTSAELTAAGVAWQPFRIWATVLIRSMSPNVLRDAAPQADEE